MRVRQLRGEGDGAVLLVYPSTIDEYWKAIDALERPAAPTADGGPEARRSERRPGPGPCHVVTTAAQRDRWGLPDLAHSRFPGHALTPTGVMAIRCKQFHLPDL